MDYLFDKLWVFVRDFPTYTYTLPKVCKAAVEWLKSMGYDVSVTDDNHRDFRIIAVDGHHYRILRDTGWLRYDVRQVD